MPSKFGGIPIEEAPATSGSKFGGIPIDQETLDPVAEKPGAVSQYFNTVAGDLNPENIVKALWSPLQTFKAGFVPEDQMRPKVPEGELPQDWFHRFQRWAGGGPNAPAMRVPQMETPEMLGHATSSLLGYGALRGATKLPKAVKYAPNVIAGTKEAILSAPVISPIAKGFARGFQSVPLPDPPPPPIPMRMSEPPPTHPMAAPPPHPLEPPPMLMRQGHPMEPPPVRPMPPNPFAPEPAATPPQAAPVPRQRSAVWQKMADEHPTVKSDLLGAVDDARVTAIRKADPSMNKAAMAAITDPAKQRMILIQADQARGIKTPRHTPSDVGRTWARLIEAFDE